MTISNNTEASRLEMMLEDGSIAFLDYVMADDHIVYTHTDVPETHEGKGIGSQLAHEAMEYALAAGLRVVAECPVVARFISKHPEYQAITDDVTG
jgi:predicted GNAT family acetyltransferase